MDSHNFPIKKVRAFRRRIHRVSHDLLEKELKMEGWSLGLSDPSEILTSCDALWLRDGFGLAAYLYRSGDNGNGVIWALPDNQTLPSINDCEILDGHFLSPPKPPAALGHYMEAVEGDGTPWSYLTASLVGRELSEYGALWHGCWWDTHDLIFHNPFYKRSREFEQRSFNSFEKPDQWRWEETQPKSYLPTVSVNDTAITVEFYTFTPVGACQVIRHIDTYKAGNYISKTEVTTMAIGPEGIVF
jgi:hypothetical protein